MDQKEIEEGKIFALADEAGDDPADDQQKQGKWTEDVIIKKGNGADSHGDMQDLPE